MKTGVSAALLALALAFPATPAAAQMPGGAPQEPPGALHRYVNASAGTHWVTPGRVAGDFSYELTLGFLHTTAGAGRSALYGCRAGSLDHFLTLDAGCEGQTSLGVYGWIDQKHTAGSAALYRCNSGGGHVATLDAGCEGTRSEGRLGYIPQRQTALARYNGGTHWVTSGRVGAGWRLENVLGFVFRTPAAGRRALYECAAGGDHFLSLDPGCEGRGELGLSGYLYATDPGTEPVVPLYRCRTGSDHFASSDPGCEGQVTEALLGYLRRGQELIQRAVNPSAGTHWVSTGPLPVGWFFEITLGYATSKLKVSAALRGRKVRRVRYGGSATVSGRVRDSAGRPVGGGAVSILIGDRKPLALGEVTTSAKGRYSFRVRPGKNRLIHAGYRAPRAIQLACSRVVRLNVRAGITLKAKPKRVRAGRAVRFRGRLLGHPIPKVGKLIDLQAFDGGRWRTFQTVRANREGRYRARYRFTRTFRSRTFRFRGRARREARYPYALGTSKVVRVRVRA